MKLAIVFRIFSMDDFHRHQFEFLNWSSEELGTRIIFQEMPILSISDDTDDRRVMAISQILYDQYHIWDIFGTYIAGAPVAFKT